MTDDNGKGSLGSWFTLGRVIAVVLGIIAISISGSFASFGQDQRQKIQSNAEQLRRIDAQQAELARNAEADQRQNRAGFATARQLDQEMRALQAQIDQLEMRINRLELLLLQKTG